MSGQKKPVIIIEESDESDDDSGPSRGFRSYKDAEIQTTVSMKFINYQSPSDPRNINFARLIAFELQFLPEERRTSIPEIFNIIRVLKGAPQLLDIVKNLSKMRDDKTIHNLSSDQAETNRSGKKRPIYDDDDTQWDNNLTQCEDDLTQCEDDLTQCEDNLAQCYDDFTKCDDDETQCDQDVIQCSDDENRCDKNKDVLTEVKEIQTNEDEIIDAFLYRQYENRISYSIEALPKIDFHNENPSDERNKDVACITVFELERMSEEKRSNAYPQVLNLIRILRGDSNQVVAFVPNTIDFKGAADSSYNPEIPLNTFFDGAL